MLLIAGCSGDGANPPPSTPQAEQPASPPVNPPAPPPPAPAPTVNAGPDQTVKLGTTVALSGSSTTTQDHPSYIWRLTSLSHKAAAPPIKDPTTLTSDVHTRSDRAVHSSN